MTASPFGAYTTQATRSPFEATSYLFRVCPDAAASMLASPSFPSPLISIRPPAPPGRNPIAWATARILPESFVYGIPGREIAHCPGPKVRRPCAAASCGPLRSRTGTGPVGICVLSLNCLGVSELVACSPLGGFPLALRMVCAVDVVWARVKVHGNVFSSLAKRRSLPASLWLLRPPLPRRDRHFARMA